MNSADQWSRLRRLLRTGGTFPGSAAAVVRPLYMGPGDGTGSRGAVVVRAPPVTGVLTGLAGKGRSVAHGPGDSRPPPTATTAYRMALTTAAAMLQLIPACFPLRVISSRASFSPSRTSVETCVQAARSIDKGQHYSFPHARCICNIICIESTKTADARSFAPCIRKMRVLLGHHVARAFRSRETCSSDSMCYTLS